MNILVFSWRDPKHPLAGGAEQSVLEHAKGWLDAGHNVTWFSSRFKGSRDSEVIDGVKIVRRGNQYLFVQIAAFFYYLKNKNNIDFVIDQFHGLPFFTPFYVKRPKIALIQEVAGKVWFLNSLPTPINWIVGLTGYLLEPWIFRFYKNTYFMTASESAKHDLERMGIDKEKITIIHHGVTLPKKINNYRKEKINTITYLGIISKDKGIEDAISCFKILNKIGIYRFWVIGRGETKKYEDKIKETACSLGSNITFWGFVSQQKKFELLAKSHLLINPSVHEGWGLVNIEANLVGTPVVSYNSAGLIDSVSNNVSGLIVKKNNPEELARVVEKILKDRNYCHRLQEGAIKWSKNFSWQKSREISLNLLKSVFSYS